MKNSTLMAWGGSVAASFALGFGLGGHVQAPVPASAALSAAPAPVPSNLNPFAPAVDKPVLAGASSNSATVDELWARALTPQELQHPGYDAEDRLRKLAQTNPVVLRGVLQRYDSARTPQARELLKAILSTVQAPDVLAFSIRLANSSNAAERKYGFELLQSVAPDSAELRALVRRTLSAEQSPEVLVQALAALHPGAAEPEESDQIVAQLKSLSQHADVSVRSQSVTQLGQWDKKGEGAEGLSLALADRAPEVRTAAIFAIAQTGVRSETVKAALMGVIGNAQESKDVRGSALQVLERFPLNKDEYARFAQARTRMQE